MSKNILRPAADIPSPETLAYSIRALSGVSCIGTTTLYLDAKEGRLKARKVGNKLIVTKQDAVEYLNSLPSAKED